MPSKFIHTPNGGFRRFDFKAPMMIDIIHPATKRQQSNGKTRELTMTDVISAPVKCPGEFRLEDMVRFMPAREK